jgi:hypothetical protein
MRSGRRDGLATGKADPPRRRGPIEVLVTALVCSLGGMIWLCRHGIDPTYAAIGLVVVNAFSSMATLLIIRWRAVYTPATLVISTVMISNVPEWERRQTLVDVVRDATGWGLIVFVTGLACHLLFIRRKRGAIVGVAPASPLWDADVDQPLAVKGPT